MVSCTPPHRHGGALVHDPKVEGPRKARATGEEFALPGQSARTPWPVNDGTPLQASRSPRC